MASTDPANDAQVRRPPITFKANVTTSVDLSNLTDASFKEGQCANPLTGTPKIYKDLVFELSDAGPPALVYDSDENTLALFLLMSKKQPQISPTQLSSRLKGTKRRLLADPGYLLSAGVLSFGLPEQSDPSSGVGIMPCREPNICKLIWDPQEGPCGGEDLVAGKWALDSTDPTFIQDKNTILLLSDDDPEPPFPAPALMNQSVTITLEITDAQF